MGVTTDPVVGNSDHVIVVKRLEERIKRIEDKLCLKRNIISDIFVQTNNEETIRSSLNKLVDKIEQVFNSFKDTNRAASLVCEIFGKRVGSKNNILSDQFFSSTGIMDETVEASTKQYIILGCEKEINHLIQQLSEIAKREEFVNPVTLKEIPNYSKQFAKTESNHYENRINVINQKRETEELLNAYGKMSSYMNSKFIEWDEKLNEIEEKKKNK